MSDELMARFVDAFHEIRRGFPLRDIQESLRKQEGLTADQVKILTILSGHRSKGLRIGDLSQRLQTHHTNAARTIRSLVATKYVERVRSESEGRGGGVKLSASGRLVADRLLQRRNTYFDAILAEFPGQEKMKIVAVLERLAKVPPPSPQL